MKSNSFSYSSLFPDVHHYLKLSYNFQTHLLKNPMEWYKFQDLFNLTVEKITTDILNFEKENRAIGRVLRIERFKKVFAKRYRQYFLFGEYPKWVFYKPFGYAGDYKIIESIYKKRPCTTGFDRLWDNYFLQMTASKATRQRKDDLRIFISNFVKERTGKKISIMNLASGPATEIREMLDTDNDESFSKTTFDCYDFDIRAINHAKQCLSRYSNVNFFLKNALRIALAKNPTKEIPYNYDLIYSAGLFDYLDDNVAIRLINNLKKLLRPNGLIIAANFGEKYMNSSAGLMEWATEWNLIYRTTDELVKLFLTNFQSKNLKIISQKNKVILYCFATNI